MKSHKINKKEAEQKKKSKKENALDIISKSLLKPTRMVQVGKY